MIAHYCQLGLITLQAFMVMKKIVLNRKILRSGQGRAGARPFVFLYTNVKSRKKATVAIIYVSAVQ